MKLIFFLAALVVLFSIAFSAVMKVRYEEGKPGHCYYSETGPMENGEMKDIPKKCTQAVCLGDRTMELQTCGIVAAPNVTSTDFSKPYPQCCPHAIESS